MICLWLIGYTTGLEGDNMEEATCVICGMKIHKDEETKRMEILFSEIWRDEDGRFGLNYPEHWHTNKGTVI